MRRTRRDHQKDFYSPCNQFFARAALAADQNRRRQIRDETNHSKAPGDQIDMEWKGG
jgi:hypothetical protein